MSHENQGHDRIRALEAELARVQSERASMDARIRLGQLEEHAPSSRRADVLAWSAFFVAAALVATLIVTLAQQAPVVRESTRVETVMSWFVAGNGGVRVMGEMIGPMFEMVS